MIRKLLMIHLLVSSMLFAQRLEIPEILFPEISRSQIAEKIDVEKEDRFIFYSSTSLLLSDFHAESDGTYACRVLEKKLLNAGESVMIDLLDSTFGRLSFSNICETIIDRPMSSLVLIGIAGGFFGYLAMQYSLQNYAEFTANIDLNEVIRFDIAILYAPAKNYPLPLMLGVSVIL